MHCLEESLYVCVTGDMFIPKSTLDSVSTRGAESEPDQRIFFQPRKQSFHIWEVIQIRNDKSGCCLDGIIVPVGQLSTETYCWQF
jgi:hypothetical protein